MMCRALLLSARILGDFCELVIANEVFLIEMEKATILALHDLRGLLNIQFKQFQRTATIIALTSVLLWFFFNHTKPNVLGVYLSRLKYLSMLK